MSTTAARVRALQSRSEPPPLYRLRGVVHKATLTAHILTSVGWLGVAVLVAFAGYAASITDDQDLTLACYRVMETSPWLTIPFALVAGTTGVLLGLGTNHGLVRRWWVVIKIAITLVVMVTDALVVRNVARDAVAGGVATTDVFGPITAHVVMLTAATILSTFKPGGRTPWYRRLRAAEVPEPERNAA